MIYFINKSEEFDNQCFLNIQPVRPSESAEAEKIFAVVGTATASNCKDPYGMTKLI
jgi:hypothetical protein